MISPLPPALLANHEPVLALHERVWTEIEFETALVPFVPGPIALVPTTPCPLMMTPVPSCTLVAPMVNVGTGPPVTRFAPPSAMMPLNGAKPLMLPVMVPLLPTTAKQVEVVVPLLPGPLGLLLPPGKPQPGRRAE